MNKEAVRFHFKAMVEELLKDNAELAGKSWKYVHCDSWEIQPADWTPNLIDEFRIRRGYDPIPYLAGLANKDALPGNVRERFWYDYQKVTVHALGLAAVHPASRPIFRWTFGA